MRRAIIGILLLAMAAAPAYAQHRRPEVKQPSAEEIQKQREAEAVDRQYRATVRNTNPGTAPAAVDPWQNMRAPGDGKR